jgi:hypothetical protein
MILLGLMTPVITFVMLLAIPLAHAQVPHETLYYQGIPTDDLVALWSTLPGSKSFVLNIGGADASLLEPLARLRGADRILVETDQYPNPSSVAAWKRLAGQGVEFALLGERAGMPTEDEVQRLNEAGFARCLFAIGYLPGPAESKRLDALRCRLALTFAVSAYPRFVDKEGLAAIPARVPTLYSTDYWPSYTHMDTLNLLPHRKRLRVRDSFPPTDTLPYLFNIQKLDSVEIDTSFDAQASDWAPLAPLSLTWSSVGHVPSARALADFARAPTADGAAPHRLVIDSDLEWTADERARVEASPLAVEWIHAAPLAAGASRWP